MDTGKCEKQKTPETEVPSVLSPYFYPDSNAHSDEMCPQPILFPDSGLAIY